MKSISQLGEGAVLGPDGRWMTLADLPPPNTTHWIARRKAAVVAAVRGGLLSLNEACARYALSVEEFVGWQRSVERYGLQGLRASHRERVGDPVKLRRRVRAVYERRPYLG